MKPQNYKEEDISTVLEKRRQVLHHLEQIEKHLWTDDLESARKQTVDMHLTIIDLNRMQHNKQLEDKFNQLHQMLNANGVHIQMVHPSFRHKKTD